MYSEICIVRPLKKLSCDKIVAQTQERLRDCNVLMQRLEALEADGAD